MRRLIATTVVVALLTFAATGTAEAHTYDEHYGNFPDYSYIYCMAHRSGSQWDVLHAWPYFLEPGLLFYNCIQEGLFTTFQYFVVRNMSTGASFRHSGYTNCGQTQCNYHGILP